MKAIMIPQMKLIQQVKDVLIALYLIFMMITLLAVLIEIKLYFNIDVVPGMDIPIDEWYAQAFH